MTVPYLKLKIEFTEQAIAETVKTWMETKIGEKQLAPKNGEGRVTLILPSEDEDVANPTMITTMRLRQNTDRDDLISKLKTKAKATGVKDKVVKVTIHKHECTHNEDKPQPCTNELVYQWP